MKIKNIIFVVMLFFLIVLLYYILAIPSEKPTDSGIEEKILVKFNLSRNDTQIARLTNLEELKKKYPVIYGEAREGDYEIRTPDKLIIYDYGNDKIIKEFDVTNIRVG
jgi:hypothetical protein